MQSRTYTDLYKIAYDLKYLPVIPLGCSQAIWPLSKMILQVDSDF